LTPSATKPKRAARLKELGSTRLSGAIQADIAAQKQNRLWTLSEECTNASGTGARNFCASLEKLLGEHATSVEAEKLRAQDSTLASKLQGVNIADAMRSADPQSEALGRLLGVEPSRIMDALAILVAVLIELGSGFGLFAISGGAGALGRGKEACGVRCTRLRKGL
jgi:hypothetical protein